MIMTRVLLKFHENQVDQPITSQVILEQGIPLNILSAHIEPTRGEILLEIPQKYVDKVVEAFQKRGVTVTVQKRLEVDEEKCIACGACYSLCPISVIGFEKDHTVTFDEEKCISCGLCVDACPVRALRI